MALPALRQPKIFQEMAKRLQNEDVQNVILTLKGVRSLVIPSDAYHGLIKGRDMIRCVLCNVEMEPDVILKESHKLSSDHRSAVENYPHVEEFAENMIRRLDKNNFYCTLCNVVLSTPFLARHMSSEVHCQELEKAGLRALAYTPSY